MKEGGRRKLVFSKLCLPKPLLCNSVQRDTNQAFWGVLQGQNYLTYASKCKYAQCITWTVNFSAEYNYACTPTSAVVINT